MEEESENLSESDMEYSDGCNNDDIGINYDDIGVDYDDIGVDYDEHNEAFLNENEEEEDNLDSCTTSHTALESDDTRKSKILPVNKLVLFFCCSMFCLSGLPVEDVVLAREHYNEKTRCEKSQFIMDSIILHTSSTGQCSYYIGTAQVCLSARRETFGIPESTFYSIKKQVSGINGGLEEIIIGKKTCGPEKKTQQNKFEVDQMVLTDVPKYTDEWPQVGKIVKVDGHDAEVQWFKGSKSGPWNPCTVHVPGKRGKRMPWVEKISCDEIWLSGFELTNKNCLPRQAKIAIDNYDN